jgi:hypothetical protein
VLNIATEHITQVQTIVPANLWTLVKFLHPLRKRVLLDRKGRNAEIMGVVRAFLLGDKGSRNCRRFLMDESGTDVGPYSMFVDGRISDDDEEEIPQRLSPTIEPSLRGLRGYPQLFVEPRAILFGLVRLLQEVASHFLFWDGNAEPSAERRA